jgi:hypothetical protein
MTLVVSGALARSAPAPTVTLSAAKLTAHWKESWLTGTVTFSGTASAAAQVEASLRPISRPGQPPATATLSTTPTGSFSGTLKLPARMLPGKYQLSVTATVAGSSSAPATRVLVNPAPDEGIVDRSYASLTKTSPRINTVSSPRYVLWVHYHFVVPPKVRNVTVKWHSPNFRWCGKGTYPYQATISSRLYTTGTPLANGVWFAYLFSSKGVAIKRVRVRIAGAPSRPGASSCQP